MGIYRFINPLTWLGGEGRQGDSYDSEPKPALYCDQSGCGLPIETERMFLSTRERRLYHENGCPAGAFCSELWPEGEGNDYVRQHVLEEALRDPEGFRKRVTEDPFGVGGAGMDLYILSTAGDPELSMKEFSARYRNAVHKMRERYLASEASDRVDVVPVTRKTAYDLYPGQGLEQSAVRTAIEEYFDMMQRASGGRPPVLAGSEDASMDRVRGEVWGYLGGLKKLKKFPFNPSMESFERQLRDVVRERTEAFEEAVDGEILRGFRERGMTRDARPDEKDDVYHGTLVEDAYGRVAGMGIGRQSLEERLNRLLTEGIGG